MLPTKYSTARGIRALYLSFIEASTVSSLTLGPFESDKPSVFNILAN